MGSLSKCLQFFPAAPKRARVGPRVTRWQMAPAVSEESTLLLLVLLLPFGHLVELVLGLPKDIMEIGIRKIALQWEERARKGQLWLLQRLGHLRWLCPFLMVPPTPTAPVLLPFHNNFPNNCSLSPFPKHQGNKSPPAQRDALVLRGWGALAGILSPLIRLRPEQSIVCWRSSAGQSFGWFLDSDSQ